MTGALRGRAFLALLARPAIIPFGLVWAVTTFAISEQARRSGSWPLVVLVAPIPTGVIAAQLVLEVQHATFAWTLPHLRRAMLVSMTVLAAVWAVTIAAIGKAAGSPPEPLVAYAALAFLGFWCGAGLFDPVHRWRGAWSLGGTATVGLLAHATLGAGGMSSLAVVIASAGMTVWCVASFMSRDVLRRRPSTPTLTLANRHLRDAVARYRVEKLAASRHHDAGAWRHTLAGAPTRVWTLAAFYERSLFGRPAVMLLAGHILITGAGLLLFFSHPLSLAWQTIAAIMFRTLVTPAGGHHLSLAFVVTCLACGPFGSLPVPRVGLVPDLVHPLSRAERARVTWLSHWFVTGIMALAGGAFLAAMAWLAAVTDGRTSSVDRLPGVIPAFAVVLSTVPFLQWRATRAEWRSGPDDSPALWTVTSIFLALAILVATVVVSVLSADPPPGVSPAVQLAGWIVWLGGALALHRSWVIRHFRTADLI